MANKEKLLASAQKSLQKGQIPKAIKDFQKIVELDPRDVRNRQKLAELFSRVRDNAKALSEYEMVAKYYSDNGFYLKAIAVYKQMQKLDPSLVDIYHRLAELNEKQGLNGNALAEYRSLVTHYEKQRMVPEAINVLQRMKEIDPGNLNIRVKIADAYVHANFPEKAREEVLEVRSLLWQKKDFAKVLKLYEIFLPMFPNDREMTLGLGQTYVATGDLERGVRILEGLHKEEAADPEILRALGEGYRRMGDFRKESLCYRQLLDKYPEDHDLREGFVRACLDGGDWDRALGKMEAWKEDFFQTGRLPVLKGFYEQLKDHLPEDGRVTGSLQTIYEKTGEGDKLFDLLSGATEPDSPSRVKAGDLTFEEPAVDAREGNGPGEVPDFEFPSPRPQVGATGPGAAEPEGLEEIPLEFLEEDAGEGMVEGALEEVELELELELEEDLESLDLNPTGQAREEKPGEEETENLSPLPDREHEPSQAGIFELVLDGEDEFLGIDLQESPSEGKQGDPPSSPSPEEFIDLSAEIMAEAEEEAAPAETKKSRTDRFGLDSTFSEFKKGVEKQIDVDDNESHYNLGIAYKEMGLLDDAIAEFDQASRHPDRLVDCLTLKGVCQQEKGDREGAEKTFKRGLENPHISEGGKISLFFELGLLCEADGRLLDALDCFQQVGDSDLFFRNVGQKIDALRKSLGLEEGSSKGEDAKGKGNKDRISYV